MQSPSHFRHQRGASSSSSPPQSIPTQAERLQSDHVKQQRKSQTDRVAFRRTVDAMWNAFEAEQKDRQRAELQLVKVNQENALLLDSTHELKRQLDALNLHTPPPRRPIANNNNDADWSGIAATPTYDRGRDPSALLSAPATPATPEPEDEIPANQEADQRYNSISHFESSSSEDNEEEQTQKASNTPPPPSRPGGGTQQQSQILVEEDYVSSASSTPSKKWTASMRKRQLQDPHINQDEEDKGKRNTIVVEEEDD